jgi:RNA polymerase sigma-70 factor, ECF subfamily
MQWPQMYQRRSAIKRENEMTTLINQLMDLYEPITRACCRPYRLPEDQVEDIMHDTFLAAYRSLPKCHEQTRLGSLLWTIAQRQAINRLRKRAPHRRREEVNHCRQLAVPPQDPAQLAQTRELRRKLHARVAALPDPWMTAVRLYYWHHRSTYEIAMQMQIKPGTIQVILHRSRQRLRRELEGLYAA